MFDILLSGDNSKWISFDSSEFKVKTMRCLLVIYRFITQVQYDTSFKLIFMCAEFFIKVKWTVTKSETWLK